ncbi:hypothetical protein RCOM_0647070 [Ricinus communis]|uniref:Uncharacterized protein n=1 Tax=Ricinus communis TaxID=3988 RepID=B9SFL1_RICCO|nr:hypothetical protein RCOM_0647070 [Ricinus communis]
MSSTDIVGIIIAINFVAMLLSVPIIGAGVWLAMEPNNPCVRILQQPVIILGILILVVALADGFAEECIVLMMGSDQILP